MALSSIIRSTLRLRYNVPIRQFVTCSVLEARGKTNWKHLAQECEDRTKLILTDRRQLKNLNTPPKFAKNISELFKFFPLSPDNLENILLQHSEILDKDASEVIEFIKMIVEVGDYDIVTQEEALLCIARCPELLKYDVNKLKKNLTNIFGVCSLYDIPWNVVIVAAPQTIIERPADVGNIVENLARYMSEDRIRDVIGNNPTLLQLSWDEIEEKLEYLQHTMHVSAYRIAMTPKSLTHDLDFFKLR